MELDKGRSTDAAREDADTPIDTRMGGLTEVAHAGATEGHKARGFDATSRNTWRAHARGRRHLHFRGAGTSPSPEESSDGERA